MAYEPVKKRNGELIYPGLVPGGEADWPISAFNGAPDPGAIDLGIFRYVAHEGSNMGLAHVRFGARHCSCS